VLIGANGAGKSNFISIFEMLQRILVRELALYTGKKGISTLFYNGREVTDSISAKFCFGDNIYSYEVEWTENDSLLFREESINFAGKELLGEGGHKESNALNTLRKMPTDLDIPQIMLNPSWRIYQFHDTSPSSRIKSEHNISNCAIFISDARNLAAYLYRLKQHFPKEYSDILNAIRFVAPFFNDFMLEPRELNEEQIVLRWLKKDCIDIFNASQLSDGTLRFICLATLLLQPIELQPSTIIIDEPELGLHPFAIAILAEMVQRVAVNKQIILSTQSVELLDKFAVDDVIVVDNGDGGSKFKRLEREQLKYWLDSEYSLGELWNKNVLGGRFSR
jgi:predicted ATPase